MTRNDRRTRCPDERTQPTADTDRPVGQPQNLAAEVLEALASHRAANAMGSSIIQETLDGTLNSGVGPLQLRRLYAFYARADWRDGLDETQIRADIVWLANGFETWVACQKQAQRDAHDLFDALQATCPLPTVADDEPDHATAMLRRARALRADPDHWANQPWMQQLMGRWTEELRGAVAAARQWLTDRSIQQAPSSRP